MNTIISLQQDLAALGVKPQDTLLMHSSMKAIGPVEGGAEAVLDALTGYLKGGTLVLPTLSWKIIDDKPPVFDARKTPSIVGLLTETFRKRPGIVRSLHPTHSVAAIGSKADFIVSEDHLNTTPCGERSAWHKLMELNGKILMAGCGLNRCTFIHGVEEWLDIPNRLGEQMDFIMDRPDGSSFTMRSCPHRGQPSEQFPKAQAALEQAGALSHGKFGSADALLLDARKTYETLKTLLRKDPQLFDDPDLAEG
ncbi:MAG: AAC(3) family N-acetyltransferase [Clostridiales bacterium]|jgi:aminoglycoside 3-N-acetyltransferase|nr:AAC(3) family N-acetyltransferase [Clostridiales bacterium]